MQSGLTDLGLGRLVEVPSSRELVYQPFEVSRSALGIIASASYDIGKPLLLESIRGNVPLLIAGKSNRGINMEQARYQLFLRDQQILDLEGLFSASGCYDRVNHLKISGELSKAVQFRNSRFDKGPAIKIIAQTFGTSFRYEFSSRDISRSGLLMVAEKETLVPFNSNTLIEIIVDPERQWLDHPIACAAKVIRRTFLAEQPKLMRPAFGVHLIELNEDSHRLWRSLVEISDSVQSKVAHIAA